MEAKSFAQGHAPTVKIGNIENLIGNPEKYKYEDCWDNETIRPSRNSTVVDWGCGTGRAGYELWKNGLTVTLVDFARNCLDEKVKDSLCNSLTFLKHDLNKPVDLKSDYGLCADVMEHIPEADVDKVLRTVLQNSREVFFNISTVEDHFGPEIVGEPLHICVHPYNWWLRKFAEHECVVLHSNEFEGHCLFHVSAHTNFWWTRGGVNTSQEVIHNNIRANAKWGVKQLTPHEVQEDVEIMLLAGGPLRSCCSLVAPALISSRTRSSRNTLME
jgi:SAM-dependent methyltransferase